MLIEQIIEFESRGPGPLGHTGHTCTPTTGYVYDKTKIFPKKIFAWIIFY